MEIILQAQGFKASDHLENLLQEKLVKLTHHTDKIMNAHVTLTKGSAGELNSSYCEIRLEVPGNDHFVKKNSGSFEQAIAECMDALEHKIEKNKDRR